MASFQVELKLEGFDDFAKVMNCDNFAKVLTRNLKRANDALRFVVMLKLRDYIVNAEANGIVANRALTVLIKGSSKPLIDHGDLVGSISSVMVGRGFTVGVNRTTKDGKNLAAILHQGATVRVTDAMRRAFMGIAYKSSVMEKGKIKPLKATTTHIVIPPRPFFKNAIIDDKGVHEVVLAGWQNAIHKTFCELHKPDKVK